MLIAEDRRPIVISGPSGAGKSTLISCLISKHPFFRLCISHTTRKRRENEKNGEAYFFVTRSQFEKMVENDEFFEYQEYGDNYYGTSKKEVVQKDDIIVLDWERKGVLVAREKNLDARFVFVWYKKSGVEARLRRRAGKELFINDKEREKDIQKRLMEYDKDMEIYQQGFYDIGIENESQHEALRALLRFLGLQQA